MFRNVISIVIIILCLGVISCGEIINEPIVINDTSTEGETGLYGRIPKISPILTESDLIFVGEVYKVEKEEDSFSLRILSTHIKIVEVLKGATTEKKTQVNINRLNENDKVILFLRKYGDCYVLTTKEIDFDNASIMWIELPYVNDSYYREDDIKLLLKAYNRNRELFSKSGKQKLFNLYSQLKSEYIQSCLLSDLEDLVDENDIEFFANGLQSDDDQYNLFSIRKIGDLRIEQFKETIADLLKTTPHNDINYRKIHVLLYTLSQYADMKYKDVFFGYLNNGEQAFRTISYHAIGILGDEETLLALVPYYEKEVNMYLRGDILVALSNIKNNDVLIPILYQLREKETEELNISFIDDIIAKRKGG